MTENLATQFVEANGYPMHVFRSFVCLFVGWLVCLFVCIV